MKIPDPKSYLPLIELAWREDYQYGDITSETTIPIELSGEGNLVFREPGCFCGSQVVKDILSYYDSSIVYSPFAHDGDMIAAHQAIGLLSGNMRSILAAERIILNFIQRLSGIATITNKYVEAVRGTKARICDTRKTTPGWRELEKYAVRCGGGVNHRFSLFDAVLVKDNHLAAVKGESLHDKVFLMLERIRKFERQPDFIQVEVDTLEQLKIVLAIKGVDIVLLDNMSNKDLKEAVQIRDRMQEESRFVQLEASGGITFDTVRGVAETGVDRISVGALTHSVRNLDIALDM